jgi:hypothetical protein
MQPPSISDMKPRPARRIIGRLFKALGVLFVVAGIGVWWNRSVLMEWVFMRFVDGTALVSPSFSGLRFGFDHATVAQFSGGIETGSGLLTAQLQEISIRYDLRIPKVAAIDIAHAQLHFAPHAAVASTPASNRPFGTLAYPLESVNIADLAVSVETIWGLVALTGRADITRTAPNWLQAHFEATDKSLILELSPGLRTAKILAKQPSGAAVFELAVEPLDNPHKKAHLRTEIGDLAKWLNTSALLPQTLRATFAPATQNPITQGLAAAQLEATLETSDNFASLQAQAFLARDQRNLAKLDVDMATSGVFGAQAKLDMTAVEMLGLLQPWQPEATRAWQLASGQVQGTLNARWQGKKLLSGTAHVSASDLAVSAGAVQAKQARITMASEDLRQLSVAVFVDMPALALGKQLAVRDLNIKARYHDDKLTVERSVGAMFGGELAVLPATFDLKQRPVLLTLQVHGVDLAQLLATLDYPKLSGSGTVNGDLPLSITDQSIELQDGTVVGISPGVLRYQGPVADKENIAFKALRNLAYQSLNAKLNYHPNGDYQMALRMEGRNPEVLQGHPLAFNLNLSGQLPDLLKRGLLAGDFEQAILKEAQSQPVPTDNTVTSPLGAHQPTKPPPAVRRQQ